MHVYWFCGVIKHFPPKARDFSGMLSIDDMVAILICKSSMKLKVLVKSSSLEVDRKIMDN